MKYQKGGFTVASSFSIKSSAPLIGRKISMNTKNIFFYVVCCLVINIFSSNVLAQTTVRERVSLDKGWLFHQGDIPFPAVRGHGQTYASSKAGGATGAAARNYDDKDWRPLNLPHDWAVEMPFDSTENVVQGYRKRGFGWYRRSFKLSSNDRGKHLELQFDGIATHATIWFNGTVVHRSWSGYTSSYIDITQLAKCGDDENIVSVRVDAEAHEGWWYEGAGIYRHTWLVKRSPVHIITDGVFAHPVKLADGSWLIPAEITLENTGTAPAEVTVEISLYDKRGIEVAHTQTKIAIATWQQRTASLQLPVQNPVLWTLEDPSLYQVKTTVKQNDAVADEVTTKTGFRTITFTTGSGFFLNGKHVKIKGVCNHQDHAGVGVAVPDALWEFRLRKLKEMGVNAYRCAHHAPAVEFLEACDSLGILVMDENRNFNTSSEYIRQLEWMVRRDRNHPSIFLWSVFNEEPMQGTEQGYEMVRKMSSVVKALDTTRPVTAAMNAGMFAAVNVSKGVDVVGFNYQVNNYDRFHQQNPTKKMTSSEDVSAFQVRGEYVSDRKRNILNAYDTEYAGWGLTHRAGWKAVAERPFLAGCFVWTGFDYRGEPTPFTWPSASSFFGILDLCGFPKTAYWIHQAQWRDDIPVLHLAPHWNWPTDSIGKKIKVMVLSNADSVKVLLNKKLVGAQKVDRYEMNTFQIPFQPGKLEAVAYKNGRETVHFKTETTDAPRSLQLSCDRKMLANDGWDAMPVTVQALDSKGRPVPTANLPVEFEISGGGNIIGLGNGDPNSHEPEKGNKRKLFNGLAQVIIQSVEMAKEPIKLVARSAGLSSAVVMIPLRDVPQRPFVPVLLPDLVLEQWSVSAVSPARPDPNQKIDDNDMNSWMPVKTGQLQEVEDGHFIIYRTALLPYSYEQQHGGQLLFQKITGRAEVWMDGKLIGTKSDAATADWKVHFPPGSGERVLSVLIMAAAGNKAGLGGIVSVQAN
jgi:beta-galactosidase